MLQINNTRDELKKFKKFLNKNRWWICSDAECWEYSKKTCNIKCAFIEILNYSYVSNPQADILTISNSVLNDVFYDLYYNYFKVQEQNLRRQPSGCCCLISNNIFFLKISSPVKTSKRLICE